MTAPMAPLAAQSATKEPITKAIAEPVLLRAASSFASLIMSVTPLGATVPTKCSSESKAPVPKSPSRPISRTTVGRNASSELNATCCASPVQSSSRNCLPARLNASSHSRQDSRNGHAGARPRSVLAGELDETSSAMFRQALLVAVDKGERAEACFRPALPAAPHQQAHGRPDPTRQDEAEPERGDGRDRNLALQLRVHVQPGAHLVHGVGEALALGFDFAANLLGGAAVRRGHRASAPPWSALPIAPPARASAAWPS